MHYLLVTVGSKGDFFPLVTIGKALKKRGHRVTIMSHAPYTAAASEHGLSALAISTAESYACSVAQKYLLHSRYYHLYFVRHCVQWNLAVLEAITKSLAPESVVVAADRVNLWADLAAHAILAVPLVRVKIDPPSPRGITSQAALLPFGPVQEHLCRTWQERWAGAMNAMDEKGSYRPASEVSNLLLAVRSGVPTIGLWPDFLLGERSHTEYPLTLFGFVSPPYARQDSPIKPTSFGRPIIVFVTGTDGTTQTWASQLSAISVEVCRRLGCNGMLLGAETQWDKTDGDRWFIARTFLPLPQVLGQCCVIVHHGGIGTAATALAEAIPQLIIPRVFAQPSNAQWMQRLGVANVLPFHECTVETVASSIRHLMSDEAVRRNANSISHLLAPSDTVVANICSYLEAMWLRRALHHPT